MAGSATLGRVPPFWESSRAAAPGECAAGGLWRGWYSEAFVVSETNGTLGQRRSRCRGRRRSTAAVTPSVNSISCAAAGECAAGGYYTDRRGNVQAFVVSETNGSWGKAIEVPGTATLNSGGYAECELDLVCRGRRMRRRRRLHRRLGTERAFVVSETNGTWGKAIEVPGTATLNTRRRRRRELDLVCRGRRVRRRRLLHATASATGRPSWSARRTAAGATRSRYQARRRSTSAATPR